MTLEDEFASLALDERAGLTVKRLILYFEGKLTLLELDHLQDAVRPER